MSRKDRSPREILDLYLDGLLTGQDLAAFERRLGEDPELAAEVERHRAVEARLRHAFAPPGDVEDVARRAARRAGAAPMGVSRRIAAAAVILIGLGAGLWWWTARSSRPADETEVSLRQPPADAAESTVALARIYDEVSQRVKPQQVGCSDTRDLAPHFADRYGQELCLDILPDLPVQGPFPCESWCGTWPSVTVLAGVVGPQPVVILVDSQEADPQPALDPESKLQIHRKDLGELVLYEVSPLPESRCLDLFYFCSNDR